MPYVSLNDLVANCPNELQAGSIIVFDGCHRVLEQIPGGITCEDVLNCIDCSRFLENVITFMGGFTVDLQACRVGLNETYINSIIVASFSCETGILIVGETSLNLSCIANLFTFSFTDGLTQDRVTNGETIMVQGLHGLQAIVGANLIQIDLPSGAIAGQVLTWNATNSVAYWANPIDICCDQIQACMAPLLDVLQHQINIIAGQLCPCGGGEGAYNLTVRSLYNINSNEPCTLFPLSTLVRSQVMNLNFQCVDNDGLPVCSNCFYASYDSVADDGIVDVNLNLNLQRSGCESGPGITPYMLSLCGSAVDLSCLAGLPVLNIPVENTVYVMKNGSDITGQIERFDKPFQTIFNGLNAAYAASQAQGGKEFTVIVYNGDYEEVVYLQNGVNVHFHKGTTAVAIATNTPNLSSKVTGNLVLLPRYHSSFLMGNAIYIGGNATNSQVDIEIDKIEVVSEGETYIMTTVMGAGSRARVKIGSIKVLDTLQGQVMLASVVGDRTSLDLVSGVRNHVPEKTTYYYCEQHSEFYWHDSYIIDESGQNRYANSSICDNSNVYIKDVYIKGRLWSNSMTNVFRNVNYGRTSVNNLNVDLGPLTSPLGSKGAIFYSEDTGCEFNFYGMNQIRGNSSRAICTRALNGGSVNVYGRLLTNCAINSIGYGTFAGANTYQEQTVIDIPVYMPLLYAYDNA